MASCSSADTFDLGAGTREEFCEKELVVTCSERGGTIRY